MTCKLDYTWHLVDLTHANWPGSLPWRGPYSHRGYPTREAAEDRARRIRDHYAARFGSGGPDLQPVWRGENHEDFECARCGDDVEECLIHHLEEGGVPNCWRCGCKLPTPSTDWLIANGFNVC